MRGIDQVPDMAQTWHQFCTVTFADFALIYFCAYPYGEI